MSLKQYAAIAIVALLMPSVVRAQESPGRIFTRQPPAQAAPPKPLTEEQRKAQAEMEKKAVALLEELIGEAAALRLIENRLYVLTTAADLLWKRDQDRARALLREAMNQFYALEAPTAPNDPRSYQLWEARSALRSHLLQLLAEREPKLALEFLRATQQAPPKFLGGDHPGPEFDRQFELQLAARLAENDPQEALRMAREALDKEVGHQVLEIWSSLQKQDPAAASKLASEIVAKLKTTDLSKSYAAAAVAFAMLHELRTRVSSAQREAAAKKTPPTSSSSPANSLAELQQTYREMLEVIAAAVLKVTTANLLDIQEQGQARQMLAQAQGLMPEFEKHLPQRAAAVRAKLNQFDKAFHHQSAQLEAIEAMEHKSATELVELAARSQPLHKEMFYRQAAMKAVEQGDTERARQIAKDHLSAGGDDPILLAVEDAERARAAEQGKFEEARQSLARLSSDNERALALIGMAKQAAAKNDQKTQKQLLSEARELLGSQLETRAQVAAQFALADGYLNAEPERSFAILEAAIEKLNAVMGAMVLLDSFDEGGRFKDGEMRMAGADFTQGFTEGFDQMLAEFARRDFDRTKTALRRWQINEVRLTMSLMLAEHFLGEPKETTRRRIRSHAFRD